MHLSLNDSEIKEAIELYISNQGINTEGSDVEIKLKAGRSGKGHSAEVQISKKGSGSGDADDTTDIFGGK